VAILNINWRAGLTAMRVRIETSLRNVRRRLTKFLILSWEWLRFNKERVVVYIPAAIGVGVIIFRNDIRLFISQHLSVFLVIVVPVLLGGIGWAERSASTRRKGKKEIEEKVGAVFIDVASLAPRLQLSEDEIVLFYSGEKLGDRFWELIKEGFDFRRSILSRLEEEFAHWDGEEFHDCKIPSGESQGKSLLMGRFAWDLAKSSDNKVLWWLGRKQHPANVELASMLNKYGKKLSKTKRLIVFMDDLFSEDGEDRRLDNVNKSSAYEFLQTMKERVFIVYPDKRMGELKFQAKDRDLFLDKLVEKGLIDRAFAEEFASNTAMRRLYGDQLRLCLNLIAEKRQFMPKFQRDILRKKLSLEEDEVLRKVSVCSTVSLPYPELALRNKGTDFWRSMKLGVLKDFLKEVELETGPGFYDLNVEERLRCNGYILIAPLFGKQILRERCGIKDFKTLLTEYQKALLEILSSPQYQSETDFALEYVRVALCRLAKNMQRPFYPEFTGSVLAHKVLAYAPLKERIIECVENLSDMGKILRWAFTMRKLQNRDVARRLFVEADAIARRRGPRELDLKHIVYLTIGLKDSNVLEQKKRAIIYFDSAVRRAFSEENPKISNQIIDAYVEFINSLSGAQQALDKLDDLLKLGEPRFKADAVLVRRRAQLLDQLPNRIHEAQEEFKRAIKLAREDPTGIETLIINLQRYARFLSERKERLDPAFQEDPEIYFQEAVERSKDAGFSYEGVLNAWAAHKEGQRDITGARSKYEAAIEYCNEQGIISSRSFLAFARFLHKYGEMFKDKAYAEWWQIAEDLCREVINYEGTDRLSKLYAYQQLGLLMGSNPPKVYELPNGSRRPDFHGALKMLEKAFESPEPQRIDDSQKTFQDCVAHRALAQLYVRWIEAIMVEKVVETESIDQLVEKAEFHSLMSFWGLSRRPNLTTRMKEYIIKGQLEYAGFQWLRCQDLESAKANYEEAIKCLENWGFSGRLRELACVAYWYAGNFYSDLYMKSRFERLAYLDQCEQLYWKALQRMPEKMPRRERSRLRYRAAVCLYQQMWSCRKANKTDAEKQKHGHASLIVEEGLNEDPRNSYLLCAKILLHIWENKLDQAMQQLIGRHLSTINQCLKILKGSNRQAAESVAENLGTFAEELKKRVREASMQNQCLFYALLSVLAPSLGSLLLGDIRVREELCEKLNSSKATLIAQIVGLLKKASRIREFSNICLSLDYRCIINSSTLPSNYRLLEKFVKKDVDLYARCFVKALPDANWADLITREDASLYRLNGIIEYAIKVNKSEAVRLIESLSSLRLNSLFFRSDPVAHARGYTQANVVNLFLGARISISPSSATKIVGNIHDQEWLYLLNFASAEQGFWLLWNLYRYAPTRAKNLAKQVAVRLGSSINGEPLLRLGLVGLLHLCNIQAGDFKPSKADMTRVTQALKQQVAKKKLTLPLLSLMALKVKLKPKHFKEVKEAIDEKFIEQTIRDNKDQNLRELLSDVASRCFSGQKRSANI